MQLLAAGLKDYPALMQAFIKIEQFGTKRLIPFTLNKPQRVLHDALERQLKERGRARVMVLKSRRMGISTYIAARFFIHSITRPNRHIHICTHEDDLTSELFRWVKAFESGWPRRLLPSKRYSSKKELVWNNELGSGLNTLYSLSTAGGREKRGRGYDYLHESEVASPPWTGEFALGMESSVADIGGTEIVRESTANGVGGFFHEEWVRASRKESDYEPLFFPWWALSVYREAFKDQQEREEFAQSLGAVRYGGEEESKLLGTWWRHECLDGSTLEEECTLEALKWRRMKIDGTAQGSLDKFRQEFPANASEAFLFSGRAYFDMGTLRHLRQQIEENPPSVKRYRILTGHCDPNTRKPLHRILLDPSGPLKVYQLPDPRNFYRIGVDVSEGIEIEGGRRDYSAVVVVNAESGADVAIWHSKIAPHLLGWIVATLGKWYQGADGDEAGCWAGIERNNHGLTTLTALRETHEYPLLHFEQKFDVAGGGSRKRFGWLTDRVSKPRMIDELAARILEGTHGLVDPELVDECMTFVEDPEGKLGAEVGCHDDLVMAKAIALQMCLLHKPRRTPQKPPPPRQGIETWFQPRKPWE